MKTREKDDTCEERHLQTVTAEASVKVGVLSSGLGLSGDGPGLMRLARGTGCCEFCGAVVVNLDPRMLRLPA